MSTLVSCLCVSRPSRWGQLQRAILDFQEQTYPDRELVVVVDSGTDFVGTVQAFVDQLPIKAPVRVLPRLARNPLDGLMYAAIDAQGQILCLWDDDNLNHPTRLEVQAKKQQLMKEHVTALTQGLYLFHETKELFVVDAFKPDAPAGERVLPTTLMAYRTSFPVMEPAVRSRPSEQMISQLGRSGRKLFPITGAPFLHLVGVAANTVRGYAFHRRVVETKSFPAEWVRQHQARLSEALDAYRWDGPVDVEGRDGGVFEYKPKQAWPADLYAVQTVDDTKSEPAAPLPKEKPTTPVTPGKGQEKK